MKETRKGLLRGVGILAAVLLAAGAISPAFSAAPLTKAKAKKIATKVLKQKIDDVGNPIFIEETELMRFGPITMSVGDVDRTIATWGPFTVKAQCLLDGLDVQTYVIVQTTEANSFFVSDDAGTQAPFGPGDPPAQWVENIGNPPGGTMAGTSDQFGRGTSPSGTSFQGSINAISNFAGSNCYFDGWFMSIVPA